MTTIKYADRNECITFILEKMMVKTDNYTPDQILKIFPPH